MSSINQLPAPTSLPASVEMSRSNSTSSVASNNSNTTQASGSTQATSATANSSKTAPNEAKPPFVPAPTWSPYTDILDTQVYLDPALKPLDDSANLRKAMSETPAAKGKNVIVKTLAAMGSKIVAGVKYLGSLIGAAYGAVKGFVADLFTSKATKANNELFKAELLAGLPSDEFPKFWNGADGKEVEDEDVGVKKMNAKMFDNMNGGGTLSPFKFVGSKTFKASGTYALKSSAEVQKALKAEDLKAAADSWHQS